MEHIFAINPEKDERDGTGRGSKFSFLISANQKIGPQRNMRGHPQSVQRAGNVGSLLYFAETLKTSKHKTPIHLSKTLNHFVCVDRASGHSNSGR